MDTRYDEALERARAGMPIDEVFPELKESEDERIRKWLIEEIKATHDYDSPTSRKCVDDALAYLEKQKEQKPATATQTDANAEWSDGDEKVLERIIAVLDRLGFDEFCKSSRDQDIEEERLYYEEIQFLKKLKSIRPQPKQDWSEEEEKCIQEASDYLRDYANNCVQGGNSKLYLQNLADRIESIRQKHHWKPSEYTLSLVKKVADGEMLTGVEQMAMGTLYNDLKKL